ncbi:unnamed protein product [Bursaphelenchus xylophilus]|uniref:(pine wood nematode) hypothetical protein n=1 Tax=Bursaphelenchus xylophilus TaxID=6326 RepID=A0A1I7RXZ3_BURXY|nr:unnamed protein product [Bursaphelenchus xylophilus]CAG9125266.1 unnamed protein product [Bursaphelenchus xylophilus]
MADETLLVLYGTETGTAMDLGEIFWRECKKRGISVRLMAFDEYNLNELPSEPFFIFIVSTSGNGELPTNMRENWRRLLNTRIPRDWLDETEFVGFGLGDSSYQKFNFAAKKLYRRLLQLSATSLADLYLADDQHELGPYGLFTQFMENLWVILESKKDIFPSFHSNPDPEFPFKFKIVPPEAVHSHSSEFVEVECLQNERVTSEDHFQETRLISFSKRPDNASRLAYEPGDVLMVQPQNLPDSIEVAKTALNLTEDLLNREFSILPTERTIKMPPTWLVPQPTTIKTLLTTYFDLEMIPKQSFLKILSEFSKNEMEKERLEEFYDPKNLDEYLDYAQRPRRTIAEALRDFVATSKEFFEVEFEEAARRLFELFVPIRPRAFSIASSPLAHKDKIQIIVAKVSYRSIVMKEHRKGLCSTFLAQLKSGDKVYVKIRKGTFKFQPLYDNLHQGAICVGPGTGIAPFRSFCSEIDLKPQNSEKKCLVFFGCRHPRKDYYFQEDWKALESTEISTSFSRPDNAEEKSYVQDKIRENGEKVWKMIDERDASIFVAGRAKEMPDEVMKAFKDVIQKFGRLEDPEEYINRMEKQARIQYETWD